MNTYDTVKCPQCGHISLDLIGSRQGIYNYIFYDKCHYCDYRSTGYFDTLDALKYSIQLKNEEKEKHKLMFAEIVKKHNHNALPNKPIKKHTVIDITRYY